MKKKNLKCIVLLLLFCFLSSTVQVRADVIFEPLDVFYARNREECDYHARSYIANGPKGKVTVYMSPEAPITIGKVANGEYIWVDYVYTDNDQNAYGALVEGKAVCAGYARAFQLLMNELDIPTYYCSGTTYGKHAWNIIYINNEYYNVDVTFNDSNNTTMFFNKNDAFFSKTHTRSEACKLLPKSE